MQAVFSYLERLRQEPEAKRRRVLWWSTSLITLVIALGWFLAWRLSLPAGPVTSEPARWRQELADVKLKIITGWQTIIPNN